MIEALGKAILNHQIEIERIQPLNLQFNEVLAIQTKFRDDIEISDTSTYKRKFKYAFDRATTFNLGEKRDIAAAAADSILSWAFPEDLYRLNNFRCINSVEMEVINGTLPLYKIDSVLPARCPFEFMYDTSGNNQGGYVSVKGKIKQSETGTYEIYPNPAKDEVYIKFRDMDYSRVYIRLYDITGKKLIERRVSSEVTTLELKSFSKGIYFIEITEGDHVFVDKIVKE